MEKPFISGIKHFIYCKLALVPTCMHTRPNTYSGDKEPKLDYELLVTPTLQKKYCRNSECSLTSDNQTNLICS